MSSTPRAEAAVERPWAPGSARHVLRRWVSARPSVYLPLARWKSGHSVLGAETEIVVDGFTRSAGTFAAIAFQLAQNDHVRLAHHMHAAASLIAAGRRDLPTLISARAPEPTILSAMVREPGLAPRQWLKTYAAFYEALVPLRDRFVVATFEDVTSDFGVVIDRVNERFGTAFHGFDHTDANVEAVFTLIDERAEGPPWQPHLNRFVSGLISADEYRVATQPFRAEAGARRVVPEHRVQRPSTEREAAKHEIRDRYRAAPLADLRARAERAYRALVARST